MNYNSDDKYTPPIPTHRQTEGAQDVSVSQASGKFFFFFFFFFFSTNKFSLQLDYIHINYYNGDDEWGRWIRP